jgi:uncharacterized protein (DUF58 family)
VALLGTARRQGQATATRDALRAEAEARLGRLELRARQLVEGMISGRHRSPFRGISVEFAEHREYTPGDELKHVDWKAFGKFDKFFIKEYEDETNLRCHLVLDTSASMAYGLPSPGLPEPPKGTTPLPKFEYAALLAASVAALLLRQQDAVGLLPVGGEGLRPLAPRGSRTQLHALVSTLERAVPAGRAPLAALLPELLTQITRRSLVLVISDLLPSGADDEAAYLAAIRAFRHRKNEVVVFHVLHPAELDFPFGDLTTFEDSEDPESRLVADPRAIRDEYRAAVQGAIERYRRECLASGVDYVLCRTDEGLEKTLLPYLARRS